MTIPTGHSPLGASGAPRWLVCPGSVGLSYKVEDAESDHARLGTAAHAVGELCLKNGYDAWQVIGHHYLGEDKAGRPLFHVKPDLLPKDAIEIDKDMADAVQVYLDAVRAAHPDRHQGNSWIERRFHCPDLHKYFYGTTDFCFYDAPERHLHIWDYKHGAGVVVEVQENEQLMYYACGMLEDLRLWAHVDHITLRVAQPRGFHWDGPVREWTTTTVLLEEWMSRILLPGMDLAMVSRDTKSGEHCRFCPARSRACPQIMSDLEKMETLMEEFDGKTADELTDAQLARFLDLFDVAKIAAKAHGETAFQRLMAGRSIPGRKLVSARANRTWREGAEDAVKRKFGKQAMTVPELKSPAEIDKLPEGKKLTAEWAFKPDAGLTLAADTDGRAAVNKNVKAMFTPVNKAGRA